MKPVRNILYAEVRGECYKVATILLTPMINDTFFLTIIPIELTTVLIDSAASLLPSLATAMGGQKFAPYFKMFLPLIVPKEGKKRCKNEVVLNVFS